MSALHINAPLHYFIGQVRGYGCRKWVTVTRPKKTGKQALAQAVMAMGQDDKRARALLIVKNGWYEPTVVMEANK